MGVGQARDHRVRAEDHRVARVLPFVAFELLALASERLRPEHRQVAVELVAADGRPPHHVGKAHQRALLHMARALDLPDDADRIRTVLFRDVTQLLRGSVKRGIPVRLLQLAGLLVADERRRQALGAVDHRVDGDALEASARVVPLVGVVRRLRDHLDLPVVDERLHAAGPCAVGGAGGAHPPSLRRRRFRQRLGSGDPRRDSDSARAQCGKGGSGSRFHEGAARDFASHDFASPSCPSRLAS